LHEFFLMKSFLIKYFLISGLSLFASVSSSQSPDTSNRIIHILKTSEKINLDGILNENNWRKATKYSDFWMKFPTNESMADPKTEVQVTYDDNFLYFGVKVTQSEEGNLVQSLKRDLGLRVADGFGIVLDPVNLKTNGFYFAVTPFNSQTEGLIGNSNDEVTITWDNTWYSETKMFDGYWTAEIAIPFSILRYDQTKRVWGINFIRSARSENEFHTWSNIPLQFRGTDLGYLGQLIWDNDLPKGGSSVSVNPYLLAGLNSDGETLVSTEGTLNAGLDAKIAVTSSVNLDLTINPDFSNVDVDEQVTNLTRFSIFFPERRVFFLENDDLFSGFGIPPVRPFYSRRIGSKDGQSVPILFGARLTGNLNKKFRFGVMNIQTGRKGESAADNFTTLTFNQQVLDRSVIKGYFTNRTAFQNEQEKAEDTFGAYGRNGGLQFSYSSKSGIIQAWAGGHFSLKPDVKGNNIFGNFGAGHFGRNFVTFTDFTHGGRNYYADVGFVNRIDNYDAKRDTTIRIGFNFAYNETGYSWWFTEGPLNRFGVKTENFLAYDENFHFNEFNQKSKATWEYKNASRLDIGFELNKVNLLFPFTFVSDENAEPLPAREYNFNNMNFEVSTDMRKNLVVSAGGTWGKFYNADFLSFKAAINVRNQPYFLMTMAVQYNDLKFPSPYGNQKFWLIAPKMEVNFANNLFWTSFVQWNSQADNFNINSRLQWRYRPMSDLFIVYSDNYFTDVAFVNKNRAVVFKVNYWLNI
jgi:hypothetical protein